MGPLAPAPRNDMHYMCKFMSTMQYTLTSSAAGTLSVVVVPQSMFSPSAIVLGQSFYPFCVTNNVTPLTPYVNGTAQSAPFTAQDPLTTTKAPDIVNMRFLNTMNALTTAGKLIVSIFYEPLSVNWFIPLGTLANYAITTQGLLNNFGYVRQYTMNDLL